MVNRHVDAYICVEDFSVPFGDLFQNGSSNHPPHLSSWERKKGDQRGRYRGRHASPPPPFLLPVVRIHHRRRLPLLLHRAHHSSSEYRGIRRWVWRSRKGGGIFFPSRNSPLRRGFFGGPPEMGQCVSRREKDRKWWEDAGSPARERGTGCLALVREQRSRLYIIRKCVVMLLCWHKYGKSKNRGGCAIIRQRATSPVGGGGGWDPSLTDKCFSIRNAALRTAISRYTRKVGVERANFTVSVSSPS
ncbi:hypothetical protein Taro_003743 [Colocasia esculenta]|uniref:Uncharacterized protein n=1 Tax=Colocasia esculenta TaxID=4460 RepID=A0A843TML0_COLES|nr:hypothetical protein [Colocasia esculenta]